MKKLYDDLDGTVKGYEHNGKYLMKFYGGAYTYCWVVSDEPRNHYYNIELDKLIKSGKIVFVDSCREGKKLLLGLNEM